MKKEKSAKMQEIQDKLKGMIGPFILCALILTGVWVIINYQGKEAVSEPIRINSHDGSETPVVMENEYLKFTMDPLVHISFPAYRWNHKFLFNITNRIIHLDTIIGSLDFIGSVFNTVIINIIFTFVHNNADRRCLLNDSNRKRNNRY